MGGLALFEVSPMLSLHLSLYQPCVRLPPSWRQPITDNR
jgi:hypothetical protein